jgi:hypothetical protein
MSEAIAMKEPSALGTIAMTLAQVKDQVHLLQEILKGVMTEGQHYGKIPGAGDKPTFE